MKIFHGSTQIIEKPIILNSQRLLDFGNAFYTTTNQNQAERWALLKKNRFKNNSKSIVSIYEISIDLFSNKKYIVKEFQKADEEWLDFVFKNRNGNFFHDYDIVIGPVANDTLYATLTLYESGILNKAETIKRLKVHKLYDQISFHNDIVLKELVFFESYEQVE